MFILLNSYFISHYADYISASELCPLATFSLSVELHKSVQDHLPCHCTIFGNSHGFQKLRKLNVFIVFSQFKFHCLVFCKMRVQIYGIIGNHSSKKHKKTPPKQVFRRRFLIDYYIKSGLLFGNSFEPLNHSEHNAHGNQAYHNEYAPTNPQRNTIVHH